MLARVWNGTNPNIRNAHGDTPLYRAAENGHTETVVGLCERGADVNAGDKQGESPVSAAARKGHTETVLALAERGADVNACRERVGSPVYDAARLGNTELVRLLAAYGADINKISRGTNWTPVEVAVRFDRAETVVALAALGANESGLLAALGDVARRDNAAMGRDYAEMILTLVRKCGVNPAGLNSDGKKARDLVPPESRAFVLLKWLEEAAHKDAPFKKHNADKIANNKKAEEVICPVCRDALGGDAIAFVPCGHRMCPGCWEAMRAKHLDECPYCRKPIAHGMPQKRWPDEYPLHARFGVEVGGAQEALRGRARRFCVEARELAPSHSDGADWQLNGTTTDGMMKSVRAVFGTCKINLEVVTRNEDGEENMPPPKICEIDKSKSIYSQICAKVKKDKWEGVEVCIDGVAQCDILIEGGTEDMIIKFNATCNKEIETAEAKRPKTPVYLRVTVEAYHVVIRKRTERQRERAASLAAGKKRFNEMMTPSQMREVSRKMTSDEKDIFFTKWGAETPLEFCFPPPRTWDP